MPGYHKLSAAKIAKLKRSGRHGDGLGLWLQVKRWEIEGRKPWYTKSWVFQYTISGTVRQMGLGPLHTVSLAKARDEAQKLRLNVREGIDPLADKHKARAERQVAAAKQSTFKECADKYIAANETAWRNEKHRAQWKSTLATYAFPTIGELPVASVDTNLVVKIIEPLWSTKPETASRVRGRIESVLDWAKVRGLREGENPARWKGHLNKVFPKRSKVKRVKHHPALPRDEIPQFMAELRDREGQSARALEFTVLTAARTGATIGARQDEIDLVNKVWTVPPERAGTKMMEEEPKPRRVPLSDRTIEILKVLPREDNNPYVFIGSKPGKPLSDMAMLELMREMRPGFVPHGFRSTFKDWCSETTNYPNEVSEQALWHTVSDEVEAAYRRGDLFEKRRRLMAQWARYCGQPAVNKSGNIMPLRSKEKAS